MNANGRSAESQIGVLGTADSWHVRDLVRASDEMGRRAQVFSFDALCAALRQRHHNASVEGLETLIVRSMPRGTLEQIIFRMDVLGEYARRGGVVMNPPRALEIAIDKYLGLSRLQAVGLRIPETVVCQTAERAMTAFTELGKDVVLKPLFGSEGRGLVRVCDRRTAQHHVAQSLASQGLVYVQRFVPHDGFDYRVLVVGNRMLGMRRSNPNEWRLNVKQGAAVEAFKVSSALAETARTAATAVGASVAGVDLLPDREGRLYVLEVNAVPGWKALSKATGEDVARLVLRHCLQLR